MKKLKRKTYQTDENSSSGEKEKCDKAVVDESFEETREACVFCNELYIDSKSGEGWIQCLHCKGWAHEACSNAEENDDHFVCDLCQCF